MKKSFLTIILAMMILLCACNTGSGDVTQTGDSTNTSENNVSDIQTTDVQSSDDRSLRDIASEAIEEGNIGDLSLVYNDDDYAADLLEFSYGIEEDLASKLESFVLSESISNSAYTFAYFKFVDGVTADDIVSVKTMINDVYVTNLKASLSTYNPDAYALCDEAVYKEYTDALLFVICEKDYVDKVVSAVEG